MLEFGNGSENAMHHGMREKNCIRINICILLLAMALPVMADVTPPAVYRNGFSMTIRLGRELSDALPAEFREQLDPQVVTLQMQDLPLVMPLDITEENHVLRQVSLSAGFIDLVNHIAHAKAIDHVQPGYFDQYIRNFDLLSASDAAAQPPNIVDARFWTENIMNDQIGYFNQIISLVMAINLSHHYLGHCAKYSAKLAGASDKPVPINSFLTPEEWAVSVKAGAVNALNCAMSTEGIRVLFAAIDEMPHRPEWTAFIIPQEVDIKGLNKQLERYEEDFFHGKLK
jgi:hypothetical protein